jgi:hypothetical protein
MAETRKTRPVSWIKAALKEFETFPKGAQSVFLAALAIAGGTPMKGEKLELVRGSGSVFRDLGRENADVKQLKALLAAEIIKALDRDELTVRAAQPVSPRPTSRGFATPASRGSRRIDWCQFSTALALVSK